MSDGIEQLPPVALTIRACRPSAYRGRGYRISGCVFVQPDTVLPASIRLASQNNVGVHHRTPESCL